MAVDDRRYGLSVDPAIGLSDAQVAAIERAAANRALPTTTGPGAAIAAADETRAAAGSGGGGVSGWLVAGVIGLAGHRPDLVRRVQALRAAREAAATRAGCRWTS